MSSDDYRSESFETTKSSEEALQVSESDQYTDHLFPLSEVEREIADEHYDDFKTYVEMLVEIGDEQLKPLQLTDCYTSERPGMYLEILPKIIFETVETETGIEEIDFPKPIFRLTIDQGTIASVEHSSSSAQTLRNNLLNSWSQYEPRLCPDEDCSSITQTESFLSFMKTAEERVFDSLIQNKVADSFVRELKSLEGECRDIESSKESVLIMKGSFLCFKGNQKQIIKSISWHPVYKDIFIVSTLRNNKFEEKTSNSLEASDDSCIFYVWNCKNQFMPKAFVEYFDEVLLHMFNPTMPNVVLGGSLSGQLILWDIDEEILREISDDEKNESFLSGINAEPPMIHHSAVSNPDHNHTRGITDFAWIPNHVEVSTRGNVKLRAASESYQIATCGSDGMLKFWDMRATFQSKSGFSQSKMFRHLDGKWEPFHSLEIPAENEKKSLSITRFAFKEPINKVVKPEELPPEDDYPEDKPKYPISTEFYAGCDDGCILCGNFKLYRDDAGKFKSYPPKFFKSPHSGPITTISVSPFFRDIFISTGSRTVAIWHHDIMETPVFSRDMHTYITSAEWSDTRPALFILGYQDGSIEMWNMLDNIYDPVVIHYVSTTSIMAVSVQTVTEKEHYAAVGDSEGIVYILSLPSSLWMPIDSELQLMAEFIEKEGIRVKSNLSDVPEKEFESKQKEETEKTISPPQDKVLSEVLRKKYAEFLELEQIQLKYLGILQEEDEEEENEEN